MRLPRLYLGFTTLMLCAFSPSLISQSHLLRDVSFSGQSAYSQAELQAFVGLKPGSSATQQEVEGAAQKLTDTGLFEEVTFSGNEKGLVFLLKAAAANTARPAGFANFVWWSDDELNQALKKSVALFRPEAVPTTGSVRDNICAALTAMLAEKGIATATVGSMLSSSYANGPLDHLEFAIESPEVVVRSLTLSNASPGMRSKLDPIVHDMAGQRWNETATYADVAGRVSYLYRNNGYDDIAVDKQEHSAPIVAPGSIELDVTGAISEGAQYRVAQIAWAGSDVISSGDFSGRSKLKPGDVDSQLELQESLQVISNAYATKGYLNAKVAAPETLDRGAHKVTYAVSVTPGPQYHFRSVHWKTLSADQAKAFDASWKMKPGDVYDGSYVNKFLMEKGMLGRPGYRVDVGMMSDSATLTVDLTVSARPTGTGN